MSCPQCNQQAISPINFFFNFNQAKIKCKKCGTKLRGDKLLRRLFYSAIIFGIILALSVLILENIYQWEFGKAVIPALVALFAIGIPMEVIGWRYGRYEVEQPPADSPLPQPTKEHPQKQWPKFAVVLLPLLGLALLSAGYFFIYQSSRGIVDREYGFKFSNIRGWRAITAEEGTVYMSLATVEDDTVISHVGVSPISRQGLPQPQYSEEYIKELCDSIFDQGGSISIEQIEINNLSGYKCSTEEVGITTKKVLVVSIYSLANSPDKEYDYVLFTSYPKDRPEEASKVEQLVQSFSAL